jgi:flagellar hook-associated protein 1 FlgK
VNYTAVEADDGTISVFLGGQSLFVIGVNAYAVQADTSGGSAQVLSAAGDAITQYLNSGQIGALTGLRNTTLPGYRAQLNTLAQSTADAVNGQLSLGLDADGLPPAVNLFSYTPGSAAQTLTVTPGFATGQLAAAEAGAPGGNGNAIALANLATANIVNGRTLSSAYADLASTIGRDLETAALGEATAQSLVTQAQSYREEVSGVSLDEEAALMVQYQRSYQAAAQLFQIANELTETLINMGR